MSALVSMCMCVSSQCALHLYACHMIIRQHSSAVNVLGIVCRKHLDTHIHICCIPWCWPIAVCVTDRYNSLFRVSRPTAFREQPSSMRWSTTLYCIYKHQTASDSVFSIQQHATITSSCSTAEIPPDSLELTRSQLCSVYTCVCV